MDLAEFLLARIAEDEAVASQPLPRDWPYEPYGRRDAEVGIVRAAVGGRIRGICEDWQGTAFRPVSEHIARWDPARVLAECEAKRRIVELFDEADPGEWGDGALRFLALPYADHPDYNPEWKP